MAPRRAAPRPEHTRSDPVGDLDPADGASARGELLDAIHNYLRSEGLLGLAASARPGRGFRTEANRGHHEHPPARHAARAPVVISLISPPSSPVPPPATISSHRPPRSQRSTSAPSTAAGSRHPHTPSSPSLVARRAQRGSRTPLTGPNTLPLGHESLRSAEHPSGLTIVPYMALELRPDEQRLSHFLLVEYIIRQPGEGIFLKGRIMKRNCNICYGISRQDGEYLHGVLPFKKNELCMEITSTCDADGGVVDGMATVPLDRVKKEREIIFTNRDFPALSFREGEMSVATHGRKVVERDGVLCCRWKFVVVMQRNRVISHQICGLTVDDCDPGCTQSSIFQRWGFGRQRSAGRADPTPPPQSDDPPETSASGTSTPSRKRCHSDISTDSPTPSPTRQPSPQTLAMPPTPGAAAPAKRQKTAYTYSDVCAGGGATVRAAETTGFQLQSAFDSWDVAAATLRMNWPEMQVISAPIEDFLTRIGRGSSFRVDVVHISYPCQGHSRRNRGINPARDAKNNELGTTLEEVLKHLRPRIVTMEQTDHILTTNEGFFFRALLSQLTARGYGAEWKVFRVVEYGVPSVRRRLIIIASCPGQRLPDWPPPTHGYTVGLALPVSVAEAIQDIPGTATQHDVPRRKDRQARRPQKLPIIDPRAPLANTITTAGVQGLLRDTDGALYRPTPRQQMRLMTLPDIHQLAGSTQQDLTTQIGNATPCLFMEKVFDQVLLALQADDAEQERAGPVVVTLE